MGYTIIMILALIFVIMGFLRLGLSILNYIFSLSVTVVIVIILVLAYFFSPLIAHAETFKYKGGLEITAKDYKTASRLCFNKLTGGKYPGEEQGLNIIDICANPIKGKVK